jgi:O-antigen/teichoic acid export membrane protein
LSRGKSLLNLTKNQEVFSRQVPKNLLANLSYFTLSVLVNLFLVPYFIGTLGVSSYGLIPLAISLTYYVNLVTQSLNASVSRYLTIDLQRQDYEKANITFNTSLFGTFGVTLLTIPILVAVSYYSPLFFGIPVNQRQDAFLLFLGIMGSLLVRTWGGNFGVSLFAYNRLDLQNIIYSINIVFQVIFIIMFFSFDSPKLCYIGYSHLMAATIAFFVTIFFSKKVNPHFKVKIQDFKISRLKELMGTGGWITVDQIGTLLLFQMDIILVNRLFGMVAGGEYSIVITWNGLIRTIAATLAGVLTPVILTYYAQKKFEELVVISKSAVKIMGLALALPIGLICGFSPLILSLWIGPDFARLSPLVWILLGHLAINLSVLPLFPINVSYNKLRVPAIATILSGIANLLLAIILSTSTGWGYYGVAIAGVIVLTARHFFFVPMYATKILEMPKNPFKNTIIQVLSSTIIVAGAASIIYHFSHVSNVLVLIILCGLISSVYLITTWYVFMTEPERRIIESFIPLNPLKKFKISTKSN